MPTIWRHLILKYLVIDKKNYFERINMFGRLNFVF